MHPTRIAKVCQRGPWSYFILGITMVILGAADLDDGKFFLLG